MTEIHGTRELREAIARAIHGSTTLSRHWIDTGKHPTYAEQDVQALIVSREAVLVAAAEASAAAAAASIAAAEADIRAAASAAWEEANARVRSAMAEIRAVFSEVAQCECDDGISTIEIARMLVADVQAMRRDRAAAAPTAAGSEVEALDGREHVTSLELLRRGGEWLGAARAWMQRKFRNGERVTWGSVDALDGSVSVRMIEELAAEVAAAAMRPQPVERHQSATLRARWKAEHERDTARAALARVEAAGARLAEAVRSEREAVLAFCLDLSDGSAAGDIGRASDAIDDALTAWDDGRTDALRAALIAQTHSTAIGRGLYHGIGALLSENGCDCECDHGSEDHGDDRERCLACRVQAQLNVYRHGMQTSEDAELAEAIARRFHEAYERLAPHYGYETRRESAVPWDQVPDRNRRLMIAVCREIFDAPRGRERVVGLLREADEESDREMLAAETILKAPDKDGAP